MTTKGARTKVIWNPSVIPVVPWDFYRLNFVLEIVEFDLHFRLHRHFQPYLREQKVLVA